MIKQILEVNKIYHRKQRHNGTKIRERLIDAGYIGGYITISNYLLKEYKQQ